MSLLKTQTGNRYAQDSISVKDIRDGVVITKDNRYIKILEVEPINVTLRSPDERDEIARAFAETLRIGPVQAQLKVIARGADTMKYISHLNEMLEEEEVDACKYYGHQYGDLIYSISSRSAISRRFFYIFKYEPTNELMRLTDADEIVEELNRAAQTLEAALSSIGNTIVHPDDATYATAEFLYMYFNPKTSLTEPFSHRVSRLFGDAKLVNDKTSDDDFVPVPWDSLISPKGIDPSNSEYILIDGIYQTHLYIQGRSIPSVVPSGWLINLIELGNGVDLDVFYKKENPDKKLVSVSRKNTFTNFKLNGRNQSQIDYNDVVGAAEAGRYIMDAISKFGEDPYQLNMMLTISANTYEELCWKRDDIITYLKQKRIAAIPCKHIEKEALKSAAPLLDLSSKIYKRSKRNVTTSGLSACFPFSSFELSDKNGVMLGINNHNNSLCMVDPFDTRTYVNGNMFVAGTSGSGKTYATTLLALRMRFMGCQCFIISPDKQHEFKRITKAINGSFIDMGPSSKDTINIMEIRPFVSPSSEFLDGEDAEDTSWLVDKIQQLKTFFSLLITKPVMSDEEEELLDIAITELYKEKGITRDNSSVYIDPYDHSKGLKTMPILGDLYDKLGRTEGMPDRLKTILRQFVTGSAQSFNGQTNVDLDNKFIVFGLEKLKDTKLFSPAMFSAIQFIWSVVKQDRTKKKLISIDEGWQLIDGTNAQAGQSVRRIFKVCRGYGACALFATQDLKDLFMSEGNYGKTILTNSTIRIILKLEETEARFVQEQLKLTEKEIEEIKSYKRGNALICANTNHVPVYIKSSKEEEMLLTTDRQKLAEIMEQKQVHNSNEEVQ